MEIQSFLLYYGCNMMRRERYLFEKIKNQIQPKDELDFSFQSYLNKLINLEMISDDTAAGIAKQVIDKGVDSLSDKQEYRLITKGLLPGNYIPYCDRCGEEIPWSEMLYALDDSLCSYCRHISQKD